MESSVSFNEAAELVGLSDILSEAIEAVLPMFIVTISVSIIFKILRCILSRNSYYFDFSFAGNDYEEDDNEKEKVIDDIGWDCAWCGTKHIDIKKCKCPNCDGVRL